MAAFRLALIFTTLFVEFPILRIENIANTTMNVIILDGKYPVFKWHPLHVIYNLNTEEISQHKLNQNERGYVIIVFFKPFIPAFM